MKSNLTLKQSRFIDEYLVDGNATRAFIAAGYSSKLAHTNANKLLHNTTIKAEIERRRAETASKLEITREGLLNDLMDIAKDNKKNFPPSAIKAIEVILKAQGWDKPQDDSDDDNDDSISEITINIIK